MKRAGLVALTALMFGAVVPSFAGSPGSGGRFGAAVAVGDINRDRVADYVVGAPDSGLADGGFGTAGIVYVYSGKTNQVLATLDGDTVAAGAVDFGESVAVGDVNKDGYGDIIVADPFGGGGVSDGLTLGDIPSGRVHVFSGKDFSLLKSLTRSDFGLAFENVTTVSSGDINGDGFADIAIGDPDADSNAEIEADRADARGAVALISGSNYSLMDQLDGTEYAPGFDFGRSTAVGDVNRDGRADIAVVDLAYSNSGRIFVISGRNTDRVLSVLDTTQFGADMDDVQSVALGRFDSDNVLDIAVGDPSASFGQGRVAVLSGRNLRPLARFDGFKYNRNSSEFGASVAIFPFVSSDNKGRLAVGEPIFGKVENVLQSKGKAGAVKPQGGVPTGPRVYIIRKNGFAERTVLGPFATPV